MDLRHSLSATVRQAHAVLAARAALETGVATMWQHLGESPAQLTARVELARSRLPDARLLLVVCVAGALEARRGVTAVELPAKHFALLHPSRPARYRVLKGGRGAAKSHSIARVMIVRAVSEPITVGCFREIQNSIRDSVHKLLSDTIVKLGLSRYFDIGVQYIKSTAGASFLFEGLHGNTNAIRSLEGLNVAWLEEAAKTSETSLEVLIPTVRAPGSELLVNYNPEDEADPVHQRFAINPPPHALVDHFTFEDNPWFPKELEAERTYLQRVDDDAYRHVWLGECRTHSDAQILKGKVQVEEFVPGPDWDGPYQGNDFGFSQDPTAFVRCWIYKGVLYIEYEAHGLGVDIDKTAALFDRVPGARNYVTRADSSRPETISYMRAHGYPNMVGVEKWQGSVEDGVTFLRSFEAIKIHPRCEHTLEEARLYSYKVDRLTGDVLPEVVDRHNHCMDALRYALAPLIQGRGGGFLAYYQAELDKQKAAAATTPTVWPQPSQTMLKRVKREGAVSSDVDSPWHTP
jgi:phage terminase large subunit